MVPLCAVVLVLTSGVSTIQAAGASHNSFTGIVGFLVNPCNGESVVASGPVKLVYTEGDDNFGPHLNFKAKGTGNQGNDYNVSYEANAHFDAPSAVLGGGITQSDVPTHGEWRIARESRPCCRR
jgi:hypothetical protein